MRKRFLMICLLLAPIFVLSLPATAQGQDAWIGTWKLNLAKSKFEPAGGAPASQTIVREAVTGGGMKGMVDTTNAAGAASRMELTTMFDGKPSEVKGAPAPNTTRVYKRINNNVYEYEQLVDGKVMTTNRSVTAADGKTETLTTTGKNAKGEPINNVAFFDKQ